MFIDKWKGHLARLKKSYRRRRDTMLGALGEFMPDDVSWTSPDGGFFVWVTLPNGIDAVKMLPEAVQRGVTYVPGADFYPGGWGVPEGRSNLRLSFSFAPQPTVREGVRILADLVREKMKEDVPDPPACGCGYETCACDIRFSCTEELVGVVAC